MSKLKNCETIDQFLCINYTFFCTCPTPVINYLDEIENKIKRHRIHLRQSWYQEMKELLELFTKCNKNE